MIYVGIDIAKLNHFAAAMSSDGKILIEPFKFLNDADGPTSILEITPYTYAIHHYQNSWFSHKAKIYYRFRTIMIRVFGYKFVRKAECLLMPWKFK